MPHVRRKARAAVLSVTLSALVLGACSDDADEPERAELRPVAQSRAPDTPVIDRAAAVPREVREKPRKRSRRRAGDGVQKAAAPSGGGAAPRATTPVATAPAPAPPATPAPPRQPAATPSKPPAGGGGGQARAKPREGECAPRCP